MTTQIAETCIYQGIHYSMPGCISLPTSDGRVKELSGDALEEAVNNSDDWLSTACWRQYIGTWEVIENRLFLIKLEGKYTISDGGSVFADWFSDTLCLPHGELLDYNIEIGYVRYAEELRLTFDKGVLINTVIVDTSDI